MASTPQDHPIRQNPAAFQAIADDAAYRARLDSLEAPDVDSLSEQYEESPASLGAYCATALTVADVDEAEAMIDDYGNGDDPSWDAVAANAGAAVSDWQCTPLSSVTDPNLLASLADAGPGEAVGPVRTADGYTVLVIDEFVDAAPKLESLFLRLEAEGDDVRRIPVVPGVPARLRHRDQSALRALGSDHELRRPARHVNCVLRPRRGLPAAPRLARVARPR